MNVYFSDLWATLKAQPEASCGDQVTQILSSFNLKCSGDCLQHSEMRHTPLTWLLRALRVSPFLPFPAIDPASHTVISFLLLHHRKLVPTMFYSSPFSPFRFSSNITSVPRDFHRLPPPPVNREFPSRHLILSDIFVCISFHAPLIWL